MNSLIVLVDAAAAVSMAAGRRVHRNGVSQKPQADTAGEVVGQRLSGNPQGGIVADFSSSSATCSSGRLSHHNPISPCLLKKSFREY